jgi:hypothetical protein
MVAKAPLDVRVKPVLVGTRDRPPQQPLYKNVGFWVVSGGIFVATVVITIVMTRPGPEPYSGNTPPYYVGLP